MKAFKYLNISTRQPPTIYMNGNQSIYIEHFESLKYYDNNRIELVLHTMNMIIEGKQLTIQSFSKNEINIQGQIHRILYNICKEVTSNDGRIPNVPGKNTQ